MPPQAYDDDVESPTNASNEMDATVVKPMDHRDSIGLEELLSGRGGPMSASSELVRNLPEIVDQLKLLRLEMEKCTKMYEHLLAVNEHAQPQAHCAGGRNHTLLMREERQSIFTPFASADERMSMIERASMVDRTSLCSREDSYTSKGAASNPGSVDETYDSMAPPPPPPLLSRRSSKRQQQLQRLPRPTVRIPTVVRNIDYSVMWVSGECGISLRNFSANKIGAQIAVLQQAEGVTTGIACCRLGDQLITVNDEKVEDLRFKEIVHKLKTTRRPITLGFRTNQNVNTSPTAAMARSGTEISTRATSRTFFGSDHDSLRGLPDTEKTYANEKVYGNDLPADRQTNGSTTSTTSTLSEDVEVWCKEQEEMHSDIIVLLTETVVRCEKLQQDNLDQLQNLMQLAPELRERSSSLVEKLAMSKVQSEGDFLGSVMNKNAELSEAVSPSSA
ncbi:TPA: hypothetical protein N0F65_004934 [Lagenidium giganteum]|uniref:PDZ domain-containing protein n=1 Tax=Lagenidium giganteum TaxID=4803 RepID=A0AAV2YU08_9STRA|nr:TPA: hypothetical protein N0F65_004934 [Lagenidium giganteum]